MGGYVLMGALAAFGLLCAMWAIAGWLLPDGSGSMAVCFCVPGMKRLSAVGRWRWLLDVGLISCPVILVDCGMTEEEKQELSRWGKGMELCGLDALADRLEVERKRFDGTGNGDHSGRGQRRGVSEL